MTELTPQQISVSFVTQYYFILSSNTKNLYKFYKTESEMTHEHSTVVKQLPGNINPNAAVGADIEKKITTLGYEECKVKLTYVDSQRSLNGAVFVFVEGVMTRQVDQKEMNFTQTFLLAEQENGYFVRNDYLRFIPDTSSNTPTTVQATQSNPPVAESSTTASVSSTSSSEHHSKSQNGHQLSFSLNSSTVNIVSATNGSHSPRSEASSTAATAGASSVYGGAEENQLDDEAEEEEIKVVEKKPQQTQQPTQAKSTTTNVTPAENKEPHGTISYAAAASGRDYKNESSEQQQSQPPKHKSGKKHNKENKEHKTEQQQHKTENKEHHKTTEQQQHNKEHKEHKEHKDHKNEHHKNEHKKPATAPVTGEKQVSAEKKEKTFRGKDHPLNKHAIYVRDLPVGTKDSDLKEAFATYGSIIDINNKSGKDQSYNKYALIFFEKQQSVDEVLKNPAVAINNHQCPITKYQRKPKQYPRTPNQPPSTTTNTPTKTETSTATTPATNNTQQPRNNNRAPRQKYTRATSNEGESEKK